METFGMYNGARIVEDPDMVEVVGEDWSGVRSHSRARRRRRKHPQNIRPLYAPMKEARTYDGGKTLRMHPETARALYAEIDRRNARND